MPVCLDNQSSIEFEKAFVYKNETVFFFQTFPAYAKSSKIDVEFCVY